MSGQELQEALRWWWSRTCDQIDRIDDADPSVCGRIREQLLWDVRLALKRGHEALKFLAELRLALEDTRTLHDAACDYLAKKVARLLTEN
jgi:hypothetical protein